MTMHRIHILHSHRPDWHTLRQHLSQWVHDPRFWAAVILGGLVILMLILSFVMTIGPTSGAPPYGYPIYPYLP